MSRNWSNIDNASPIGWATITCCQPSLSLFCSNVKTFAYCPVLYFDSLAASLGPLLLSTALDIVVDCLQIWPPIFLPILYMHDIPLIQKWSLFTLLLNLDWPCDLHWPTEYSESNIMPVKGLGLKRHGSFCFCPSPWLSMQRSPDIPIRERLHEERSSGGGYNYPSL